MLLGGRDTVFRLVLGGKVRCGDTAFNVYATYAAYDIESGNKPTRPGTFVPAEVRENLTKEVKDGKGAVHARADYQQIKGSRGSTCESG